MDYKQIIDKLVRELSYRVGVPNIKNKEHQSIMSEILSEWGEYDVKERIFEFLTEEPRKFTNPILNRTVKYKDKNGNEIEGIIGNLLTSPKDSPGRIAAEKMLPADGTDERDAINKEVGSQGTQKKIDSPKGDSTNTTDDTKTTQGSALKSKSYQKRVKKEKKIQDKLDNEKSEEESTTSDLENSPVSRSQTIDRGGDSKVKNLAFKYGFKEIVDKDGNVIFKPAPGNAGSLLNEVVSGEVAQMLEEDPNLSDEQLIKVLKDRFGNMPLFNSTNKNGNTGSGLATGVKASEIPEGENRGLHSKLLLAVRSGRRKHTKCVESAQKRGFKNSKIENYYGHSSSFDAMVNDIKDKQVIGPNGEEISQEEAEQLIRSGGGGDNPSDTASLVFDKDSNKVILLFHSDKDSTSAIVAQSSLKAEAEANEENIDKLVSDGKLTKEQGDKVKKDQEELVRKNNEIESELKEVGVAPAKFFLENIDINDAVKSVKNNTNADGSKDKNSTLSKFGGPDHGKSAGVKNAKGVVNKSIVKYLPDGVSPTDATDAEALTAFFKFMADDNKEVEPTEDQVTLMERLNSRFIERGAPDIFSQLEDIRNRTLQLQRDFIDKQDNQTVKVNGKDVGVGTFLEGSTVFKQFHLEAVNPNSQTGVHKFPGMFETNHGGLAVDGETVKGCLGGNVQSKDDFISRFEVGALEEQVGVSGSQKGKTTGGKRMVYAITTDGRKIEVGQKVMRTKTGKTGKLQTVYQWSDDMKKCFASK
jgi:hypothetical protein